MTEPTAELLQALEHALEEVRRLSPVLRHVLERQQAGERISDAAMTQDLEQLARAEADRERMQEAVRAFWAMPGKQQAH